MSLSSFFTRLVFRCSWSAGIFLISGHVALCSVQDDPSLSERIGHVIGEKKIHLRLKGLADIGAHLSLSEMASALAFGETLKELRERAVFREAAIKHWGELAPAEAWSFVVKMPGGRGKLELLRNVATNFASKTPGQAAAALTEMNGGRSKIEVTAIIAEVWAKADLPAALNWVRTLPPGPAREAALYNLRFIWVHADPAAAAEEIEALDTSDTKRALIMNIAGEWAARDPSKALAWARRLKDPAEQGDALFNIAESWADTHPSNAGEFALQLPSPLREKAAAAVAARWATQNPKDAGEWVIRTNDAVIQNRGLTEIVTVWTAVDPDAAQQWIKALDPAALRDTALQIYSEGVMEWAPETATKTALQISDRDARSQRLETALAHWWEVDPTSAHAWLEATDLPADFKREWLSRHTGR